MAIPPANYATRIPTDCPTSYIWQDWCSNSDTTGTSSSLANDNIWFEWTTGTGTSTTISFDTADRVGSNTVWYAWNTSDGLTIARPTATRTPEEQTRHAEAMQLAAIAEVKRQKKVQEERAAAEKRAQKLLLSNLNHQQKQDWLNAKFFVVKAKSGRTFKVTNKQHSNVIEIDGAGNSIVAWCAGPSGGVPVQDQFLAQKYMLECNEDAFFQVANRHTIEHSNVLQ